MQSKIIKYTQQHVRSPFAGGSCRS